MLIGLAGGIPFQYSKSITGQISALFAQGEKGVHFDPSDITTLFQDNIGTTPVTAVGQTVGLMLDKSKGLVLGPELVTNGGFDSAASWSAPVAGASITGGVLAFDGVTSITNGAVITTSTPTTPIVAGRFYQVTYTINGGATNSLSVNVGGTLGTIRTSAGTYTEIIAAATTAAPIVMARAVTGIRTGSVDNISVKELPGYHATQPTSTARPILGRHPITGRRNLLTYTEDFSNAAWTTVFSAVKTPNYGVAPDGTTTACRVQIAAVSGSAVQQTYVTTAGSGVVYTDGIWVKSTDGTNQGIRLKNTHAGVIDNFKSIVATNTWQYFSFTVTNGVSAGTGQIMGIQGEIDIAAKDVLIWHPTLELGSTATSYQKVVSTYDVTEAGVNDAYYLKFDGVDDFMVTPSIDFSGTDKMSVFAGVRKLSDVPSIAVELSIDSGVNAGAFYLGQTNTPLFRFQTGGTTVVSAYSGPVPSAPESVVFSAIDSISAPSAQVRINGTAGTPVTTTQGTGNFGNYPLYIGMRGGTSLPFNVHLYSLVVRGALSDASQIGAAEVYCNSKTGAY